ncbi:MAG: hypothetical protein K8S15_12030 [Candidatus Aegiribacteria sp.]|nr:hypothetical protein [Candidatus Aegiribacteria sp.]
MKKSNSALIEELKFVLKRMNRLREAFRIEKEEALENTDIESLKKLRERSKFIYQLSINECLREITMLKNCISSDQPGMEEADDLAELCRSEAMQLKAHISSAPNRLIRAIKAREFRN